MSSVTEQQKIETTLRPSGFARLRGLWAAVAMLAVFWATLAVLDAMELTMFQRFVSRMATHAILLLTFVGWWLFNRQYSRSDRWLALAVTFGGWIAASLVADPTVKWFGLLLFGLPWAFTLWTGWMLLSRDRSLSVQRAGFAAVMLIVWSVGACLRWDGLDGHQKSVMSWRWQPTAEQRFLTEHASVTPSKDAVPVATKELQVRPGDWPEFRGAQRDGRVHGTNVTGDWNAKPPKLVWKQRVGPAWSSVCIVDDKLFTQEQRGDSEAIVCYDASTGKEVWAETEALRFNEALSGAGPRSTPTFSHGKLLTIGGTGWLSCLDAATGKVLWSHDTVAETGAATPQWGVSDSPLVVGDLVIAYAGGTEDRGLLAYRVDNGEVVWNIAAGKQSYNSPELLTIDGVPQVLMHSDTGIVAVEPATGKTLWNIPSDDPMATPIVQPQLVADGQLLVTDGDGLCLFDVKRDGGKWTVAQRWKSKALKPSFNDVVVFGEHIYGFDDGIFGCMNLADGKRCWKRGRYGHGQVLLLADEALLLVISEKGEAVLVEANPNELVELGKFQAITGKTWNHPVVAHGRLFARNDEEMACYELTPTTTR